jgi:hypothetical protein
LAGAIVDIATGHTQPQIDSEPSAASQLGGLGGLKGGRARADRSRGNNAKRSPVGPPL